MHQTSKPSKRSWFRRLSRSGYLACASAVMAGLLATAPRAGAQIMLVPAQDGASLLGPSRAKGAVIWSHGRSIESEDSLAPTPGYIEEMRRAGWDTFRLNRMRVSDTLPASSAALARSAEELKRKGYHRVTLTGQSFGAFISIMAAGQSDAIDAVVGTAPAAYGNFEESYDTFRLNATKLYEILNRVRHARVALVFFHGDSFDPGGRGEASENILERRGLPHLIIDQPPKLASHWAASTPAFALRYSGCLSAFAEDDAARDDMDCATLTGARQIAGMP